MTHAGIDCGTTLIKAYWQRTNGSPCFRTVPDDDTGRAALVAELTASGIQKVRTTGTGAQTFASAMYVSHIGKGIDDEISVQALGSRVLIGADAPRRYLLASVGTGVSYTGVSGSKAKRSPIGSAHGGGTIMGLASLIGVADFAELQALALQGTPPDLLVKDKIAETAGTPTGELIIAHFAKKGASKADLAAGIFSFSAASVFKDLAILGAIPFSPKHVVIVGSVGTSLAFLKQFRRFTAHFKSGVTVHYPTNGEYAAAVGAWLAAQR